MKPCLIICCFALLLVSAGCSTVDPFQKKYDLITWTDGIDRKEANLIGEKYLRDYEVQEEFDANLDWLYETEKCWIINFRRTADYPQGYKRIFSIGINKHEGEVVIESDKYRMLTEVAYKALEYDICGRVLITKFQDH